jgi:exodeoxyribonuclease VII small subunit
MSSDPTPAGDAALAADAQTASAQPAGAQPPSPPPASYEAAVERLEEIIARLDSGQAGLRETLDLCAEGKGLIEFAANELDAVGKGLDELRLDELIARLEASAPAAG